MERRDFLKGLATLASLHALPGIALAETRPAWAAGFQGLTEDMPLLAMHVKGKFPEACLGTLYRNGPTLYERAGQRYRHWFDPDGMVQAFRLTAGGVTHQGRFVRTRKFLQEEAAGRFLFNGAGTEIANPAPARNNEDFNVANINIQPLNGELLAMWEAGSAYRIDPATLETLGTKEWSEELAGVPFSAHPHFDEGGDLWNIGSVSFASTPRLVLYHVSAAGKLVKQRMHTLDFAGYMHDFVLTPRYLVALNSSAVIGRGSTFVDSMHWQPERPSQLLVFDREDFSLVRTVEVPATFVFHFGNGWESGAGLEFAACEYPGTGLVKEGMSRLAQQLPGPYHDDPRLVHYRVDLKKGAAVVTPMNSDMEFPGFDRRTPFRPQRLYGVGAGTGTASGLSSAIVSVDPRSGDARRFDYGDDVIVEEPQYLPGGYLLHSFLDFGARRTGIAALKADALEDGPVAVADMDRVLPLGFHGCFSPA